MTTPYALRVMRKLSKAAVGPNLQRQERAKEAIKIMASSRCFDLNAVVPVLSQTMEELRESSTGTWIPHSNLLFMPFDNVWLEFKNEEHDLGVLVQTATNGDLSFITFIDKGDLVGLEGSITQNNDSFAIRIFTGTLDDTAAIVGLSGLVVASALILINAPRGVDRQPVAFNRTLADKLKKKLDVPRLYDGYNIVLSTTPGDVSGSDGGGSSSPKMFHFCRSHLRKISDNKVVRVKAHWRGDPSLGVKKGDYKLI